MSQEMSRMKITNTIDELFRSPSLDLSIWVRLASVLNLIEINTGTIGLQTLFWIRAGSYLERRIFWKVTRAYLISLSDIRGFHANQLMTNRREKVLLTCIHGKSLWSKFNQIGDRSKECNSLLNLSHHERSVARKGSRMFDIWYESRSTIWDYQETWRNESCLPLRKRDESKEESKLI
jgi:hypothetical protein